MFKHRGSRGPVPSSGFVPSAPTILERSLGVHTGRWPQRWRLLKGRLTVSMTQNHKSEVLRLQSAFIGITGKSSFQKQIPGKSPHYWLKEVCLATIMHPEVGRQRLEQKHKSHQELWFPCVSTKSTFTCCACCLRVAVWPLFLEEA